MRVGEGEHVGVGTTHRSFVRRGSRKRGASESTTMFQIGFGT
jgi:hypothetical protein